MADWKPTTVDVAAHLRARTKNNLGDEVGDFTDETRPTGGEVQTLIDNAARRVSSRIGVAVADTPCDKADFGEDAKSATALLAAMYVELSYFPEQIGVNSPYDRLKDLYDEEVSELAIAIKEDCGVGPGSEESGAATPGSPEFDFEKTIVDLGMEQPW